MKVLTLWQPWATLVAIGAKKIETRSWQTQYRGPLLIHAGASFPPKIKKHICMKEPFHSVLEKWNQSLGDKAASDFRTILPLGKIVCRVDLVDIKSTDSLNAWHLGLSHQEAAFGDYGENRYGWFFANVKPLAEPIPFKGRQCISWIADDVLPKEVCA